MKRVAILISGGGSNMAALLRDMTGDHAARPVLVLVHWYEIYPGDYGVVQIDDGGGWRDRGRCRDGGRWRGGGGGAGGRLADTIRSPCTLCAWCL